MKQRFCIGFFDISKSVSVYSSALKELGYETTTVVETTHQVFSDKKYDYVLFDREWLLNNKGLIHDLKCRSRKLKLGTQLIFDNEVFIFTFGSRFFPRFLDYRLIKALGKKIVSVFLGCDIRHWSSCEKEFNDLCLKAVCNDCDGRSSCFLEHKLLVVKAAEKYSDLILSTPDQSQLLTRPYKHFWIPLELRDYDFCISDNPVPKIIHAPTNRSIKGTKYILEALERLKQNGYSFELILIEGRPNKEVLEILSKSDIVVDQLFSTGTATFSLESLASGNVVLTGCKPDYQNLPQDCPVVDIGIDNIYDKLKMVLDNRELRINLAKAGRQYVEKYHHHIKLTRQILEWIGIDQDNEQ